MKNQKVIIRADRAGVFFGEIKERNGSEVVLTNARKLWQWRGASAVEQLSVDGVKYPADCKFTITVDEVTVLGVIQILPCTEIAVKSIESVKEWKQ
jgi:hypothetical protein